MEDQFHTTQWSLVVAAGQNRSAAMETLCQSDWFPVYAFIRRRVGDEHQAQDLTQAFFADLLSRSTIAAADPDRGRFRAYLLTACKRFMVNEHERTHAAKRGGGVLHFPLDFASADGRYSDDVADQFTPETLFEKQWALTLMQSVLEKIRSDYAARNKSDLFDALKQRIIEQQNEKYSAIAEQLGISEAAVKAEVYRLRSRYRELMRAEIARTVDSQDEIESEIRTLFAALAK